VLNGAKFIIKKSEREKFECATVAGGSKQRMKRSVNESARRKLFLKSLFNSLLNRARNMFTLFGCLCIHKSGKLKAYHWDKCFSATVICFSLFEAITSSSNCFVITWTIMRLEAWTRCSEKKVQLFCIFENDSIFKYLFKNRNFCEVKNSWLIFVCGLFTVYDWGWRVWWWGWRWDKKRN
jgi:hypothetical protein